LPIVAGIVAILLGVVFWPRAKTPPPAAKPATPAPPVSAATMAPQVEPVGQQTMPPPPLADGAQPPEPGGPGQGPPEMGQDGMILPMRPPHRPNFKSVQTGPVDSMLAQVADYAAKHPDDYMSIIAACRQTGQAAAGGPEEQKVDDVTREWEAKYTKISDAAIKTYTAKMQEQLRTGNAQGAYDTWRDFPANLRSREIDMQIRQILQRSLPQDFQAQP